jgi:hypothetical protein
MKKNFGWYIPPRGCKINVNNKGEIYEDSHFFTGVNILVIVWVVSPGSGIWQDSGTKTAGNFRC